MAQLNLSTPPSSLPLSEMAENLIGSEIIKLGNEIRERLNKGEHIYNFTIGDFDPKHFPIPVELKEAIIACYEEGFTNYPVANGYPELRKQVAALIRKTQGLDYSAEEILIAGGARPVIYAAYRAILDPGDKVVFPVPSWNNNHYTHLSGAQAVMIETEAENHFMPTAASLAPHLSGATLLALCSPLNPTGTAFTKAQLEEICDLVVAENARRKPGEKPLYLMYDQIYNLLTFGETEHVDPVSLRPELRPYTIFVDGISKSLAATGVRVGWCFGPAFLIDKMKSILGHVGAWAPRPEQIATARYLAQTDALNTYLTWIKTEIHGRLLGFYNGFNALRAQGHPVEAVAPQGAIYLTIRVDLTGKKTADGRELMTTEDTTAYLLSEAKLAVVPFYAFGSSRESRWYRLSVGTASMADVSGALESLRQALEKLN
jgi:aspartate aminotransferase